MNNIFNLDDPAIISHQEFRQNKELYNNVTNLIYMLNSDRYCYDKEKDIVLDGQKPCVKVIDTIYEKCKYNKQANHTIIVNNFDCRNLDIVDIKQIFSNLTNIL